MAKPIPVFTFVFAAYAATSARPGFSSRRPSIEEWQGFDPFLEVWRARSKRAGGLSAKLGLLAGAAKDDPRFAARSSNEAFEELWLEDIAETPLGFIGAAVDGPKLPPAVTPGQRMRFHRINVLDWRWADDGRPAPARPRREFANLHPREMLAELSETVGT